VNASRFGEYRQVTCKARDIELFYEICRLINQTTYLGKKVNGVNVCCIDFQIPKVQLLFSTSQYVSRKINFFEIL
jgi:hypothetical protein